MLQGRPAKPLPTAKADLESLFEFSRWEKILNVSQGIHLRFFPISKIEYQLNLHFLATGRFCGPSLGLIFQYVKWIPLTH
jgi:hypothetical protein